MIKMEFVFGVKGQTFVTNVKEVVKPPYLKIPFFQKEQKFLVRNVMVAEIVNLVGA